MKHASHLKALVSFAAAGSISLTALVASATSSSVADQAIQLCDDHPEAHNGDKKAEKDERKDDKSKNKSEQKPDAKEPKAPVTKS